MAKPGRKPTGKSFGVLALDIDAKVLDRLKGCAEMMRGHSGWTKTGIVEKALTHFFDHLERTSGVTIPPPLASVTATPHPLMKKSGISATDNVIS